MLTAPWNLQGLRRSARSTSPSPSRRGVSRERAARRLQGAGLARRPGSRTRGATTRPLHRGHRGPAWWRGHGDVEAGAPATRAGQVAHGRVARTCSQTGPSSRAEAEEARVHHEAVCAGGLRGQAAAATRLAFTAQRRTALRRSKIPPTAFGLQPTACSLSLNACRAAERLTYHARAPCPLSFLHHSRPHS